MMVRDRMTRYKMREMVTGNSMIWYRRRGKKNRMCKVILRTDDGLS